MVAPETWAGLNEKEEIVAQYTAADANQHIDPSQVQEAIDKIKEVFKEGFITISTALGDIETKDAIIVQGTNMDTIIEETAKAIVSLPDQLLADIDRLYGFSVDAHDELQKKANLEAYNSAANASGVITPKQIA